MDTPLPHCHLNTETPTGDFRYIEAGLNVALAHNLGYRRVLEGFCLRTTPSVSLSRVPLPRLCPRPRSAHLIRCGSLVQQQELAVGSQQPSGSFAGRDTPHCCVGGSLTAHLSGCTGLWLGLSLVALSFKLRGCNF